MSRNQPGVSPEPAPRPGPNQRRTNPPSPLPGGAESKEKVEPFQSDTATATTGVAPFMDLMGQVMSLPEYKDAPRVFVIAANGSDHRGQAAVRRLHDAWPNAIMIHTPVHASWLNQAEIFFSITQKKVISPSGFASLDELAGTLLAFVDRYNQTARPFNWKFTAADLARLLDRISAREHAAQNPAKLPEAA
jgi:DDE superfamily endonuclease